MKLQTCYFFYCQISKEKRICWDWLRNKWQHIFGRIYLTSEWVVHGHFIHGRDFTQRHESEVIKVTCLSLCQLMSILYWRTRTHWMRKRSICFAFDAVPQLAPKLIEHGKPFFIAKRIYAHQFKSYKSIEIKISCTCIGDRYLRCQRHIHIHSHSYIFYICIANEADERLRKWKRKEKINNKIQI